MLCIHACSIININVINVQFQLKYSPVGESELQYIYIRRFD